ncbi:MAG: peptidase U32 family protein [Alistipes onderdonkii]
MECFVHGAICVGYSGRCFLSRSVSDRSGNRGACSQPCRLTYDLTDGRGRTYIAGKHLLSVRDLNLSAHIGELLDAGVTSFKIEGRLKDVGYIKNIVAYYRREVDAALAVRPHLRRASAGESIPDFTPDTAKSFTRGESEYFFAGKRPGVASFDTPKAVGEYVGRVVRVEKNRFRLDRGGLLAAGDGICFLTDRGSQAPMSSAADGELCDAQPHGRYCARDGEVYRNYDHRFNQLLARSRTRRVIPASVLVEATAGGVRFSYTDCEGVTASAARSVALERAKNAAANTAALRTQAVKGGDTVLPCAGPKCGAATGSSRRRWPRSCAARGSMHCRRPGRSAASDTGYCPKAGRNILRNAFRRRKMSPTASLRRFTATTGSGRSNGGWISRLRRRGAA